MRNITNYAASALISIAGFLFAPTTLLAEALNDAGPLALDTAVSEHELAAQRGREGLDLESGLTHISSDLDARLTNPVADSNITGNNIIDGSAFTGSQGHLTAIQNTGNNVVIQESTIYNFNLRP